MAIFKRNVTRVISLTAVQAVVVAFPFEIHFDPAHPTIAEHSANAKSGNNGNGGGNGNGNGNNGNGNSGKANGGTSDHSKGGGPPSDPGASPSRDSDFSFDIRHTNGISETLRRGRYIMRDAKGRTIVNRPATAKDVQRLSRLLP